MAWEVLTGNSRLVFGVAGKQGVVWATAKGVGRVERHNSPEKPYRLTKRPRINVERRSYVTACFSSPGRK